MSIGGSPVELADVGGRLWVTVQAPTSQATAPVAGPSGGILRIVRQRFFENEQLAGYYFMFNTARPLFAHPRLRRAVGFAIDRAALAAEKGEKGPQRPTDRLLPPGVPGFRDIPIFPLRPDVVRARRLAGPRHTARN